MKMTLSRALELIEPLKNKTARGLSKGWAERLVEALEYVIEHETPTEGLPDGISDNGDGSFTAQLQGVEVTIDDDGTIRPPFAMSPKAARICSALLIAAAEFVEKMKG